MSTDKNQNPEQIARDKIDKMLVEAGWIVQSKNEVDLGASKGVAVREYQAASGFADYVLFVDKKPVGIIEAKKADEGHKLTAAEDQAIEYANAKLKYLNNDPLPFVFESTGTITRFRDLRDPKPRGRNLFWFYKPETLAEWLQKDKSLRGRLLDIPALNETGLRPAQIKAIKNLETSFKKNKPKALIQMATDEWVKHLRLLRLCIAYWNTPKPNAFCFWWTPKIWVNKPNRNLWLLYPMTATANSRSFIMCSD